MEKIDYLPEQLFDTNPKTCYSLPMAKRSTTLGPKVKSKGSHKTAKRLAAKKVMLAKKKSK